MKCKIRPRLFYGSSTVAALYFISYRNSINRVIFFVLSWKMIVENIYIPCGCDPSEVEEHVFCRILLCVIISFYFCVQTADRASLEKEGFTVLQGFSRPVLGCWAPCSWAEHYSDKDKGKRFFFTL